MQSSLANLLASRLHMKETPGTTAQKVDFHAAPALGSHSRSCPAGTLYLIISAPGYVQCPSAAVPTVVGFLSRQQPTSCFRPTIAPRLSRCAIHESYAINPLLIGGIFVDRRRSIVLLCQPWRFGTL